MMKQAILSLILIVNIFVVSAQNNIVLKSNGVERLNGGFIFYNKKNAAADFSIKSTANDGVSIFSIETKHVISAKTTDVVGLFFNNLPNVNGQVAMWRYKPWNSWTKPIALKRSADMPDWDVQFFYWRYQDGTYGAAVPMSGSGFRTTFGAEGNIWGSKSLSLDGRIIDGEVPAMAIAFGNNPYTLFAKIYAVALQAMGKGENLRVKKQLPEPLKYLGWCTYNALSELNSANIMNAVKSFTDRGFPLKMVLIDGGWNQTNNGQLVSQMPNHRSFPNGFKPMIDSLKQGPGIKYMGLWHNFGGDLFGIDPKSDLGLQYKNDLFSWMQGTDGKPVDTTRKTYYFIKPGSEALDMFYDTWYSYFKQQGFDFTKVDDQLVTEKMAFNNYPVFSLSEKMHQSLYKASNKYLNGYLINCMDMTAEAYLNFGASPVARTVEDYFPYKKDENYNLQKGNAAAHVLQAIYNSLYFTQMVYPDFDMFASNNPNAVMHAIARALTCGPVYVTDKPGTQNFDVLNALVYCDGRIVHSQNPLLPTADCLFQVQDKKIFKAFTTAGNTGLLTVLNAADADNVSGSFCAADIDKIPGENFIVYEHFSNRVFTAKRIQRFRVNLPRLGYKLYYIVPVKNGFAPIGLTEKYNAPETIISQRSKAKRTEITLYEGGEFKAYSVNKPSSILINGAVFANYKFKNKLVSMMVPTEGIVPPVITFNW